jgi:oxygen-independent coproporphyrinogen-3 oxidase
MSVPFCRTKCSYCNFASDVFSRAVFERYIDRVCEDIDRASATAVAMGGVFENEIDSVYIGGGTPSILEAQQFERLFVTVRRNFRLRQDAEITVECAPGNTHSGLCRHSRAVRREPGEFRCAVIHRS